jgi:hypothetical protein
MNFHVIIIDVYYRCFEIYHDFLVFFIPFFWEMGFFVLFFDGRFQILHEYSCTFLLNLIFCNDIYFC